MLQSLHPDPHRYGSSSTWPIGAFIPWVLGVLVGFVALVRYSFEPGSLAAPPDHWPNSNLIRSSDRPTVLMFLHPFCPCSHASVEELNRVLARAEGIAEVYILFIQPPGVSSWDTTSLWAIAKTIPDVRLVADTGAIEARRFGISTSGTTLLFGKDGRLVFHGGITGARGHAGDNLGASALWAGLCTGRADPITTEVFGCPLFDSAVVNAEVAPCHQ